MTSGVRNGRGARTAAETAALDKACHKSVTPDLLTDVASARIQRRDSALTVRSLLESERVAPNIVHEHYVARQIATDYWASLMIRLGNARARAAMRPRPELTRGLGGGRRWAGRRVPSAPRGGGAEGAAALEAVRSYCGIWV